MDDDQNELIRANDDDDDDSLSENEDYCLPTDNPTDTSRHNLIYVEHTKTEFLILKVFLIVSTLAVLIIFPFYVEAVNVKGDVYSLLLTNTLLSLIVLILITVSLRFLITKYKNIRLLELPLPIFKLAQISLSYFASAIIITFALDRKRVVCHLQDPIKGVVLVFSLLYYFFFSQRFMCLQRIFSITVIIVGLFIALDYNLCNEFKCRGYERERVSDDTGKWSRQIHIIWTTVYILGLALFAGHVSILEQAFSGAIETIRIKSAPFLNTVTQSVSAGSASASTENQEVVQNKKINPMHLAMWLHVFGLLIIVTCCWTSFVPQIGKGFNSTEAVHFTINGIRCHFSSDPSCQNLALIIWLFMFSYVAFFVASLQFVMWTQSAVYTIATMSVALPLAGICWSLIQLDPTAHGFLVWKPTFSGELISSLLGLSVIGPGLYFLYKSHSKDCHWSGLTDTSHVA